MPRQPPVEILPIQIREDLNVQIAGIPHDLTKAEADKIARVVMAMAMPEVADNSRLPELYQGRMSEPRLPKISELVVNIAARYSSGVSAGQMLIDAILLSTNPGAEEKNRDTWLEYHSVAHLWAALLDYIPDGQGATEDPFAVIDDGDYLFDFLHRAEHLLGLMQARPDLRHPNPWRCNEEVRKAMFDPKPPPVC
jgi:hypothetical protein